MRAFPELTLDGTSLTAAHPWPLHPIARAADYAAGRAGDVTGIRTMEPRDEAARWES